VFGGLTAVNAALMPNGEIVQSAVRVDMTVSSRALIDAVLDETFRVAAPEGYRPPDGIKDTARALYSQSDSTYGPSILVDMENGRTTEGEHTIGDLVDRANKHGVPVPILAAARTNLQVYEAGRIKA
jgi:2-dehydropantoate 2-reductase